MRFVSKVLSSRQVTPTVWLLRLSVPEDFTFKAGQFVMVHFNDGKRRLNKSYSISSSPSIKGEIEFCIKKVEGGAVSNWLCSLQEGNEVDLSGPYGFFVLKEPLEHDIIFAVTGTGVSAPKSMIDHIFEHGTGKQVWLFLGVRNEQELLYHQQFLRLAELYENFHYEPVLSQPSEAWKGLKGYVQDHFPNMVSAEASDLYTCGVLKAVDDIRREAERIGFEKQQIHFEKYV